MENRTIYIAGKITGIEKQAKVIFDKVEEKLKKMGYNVINPMKLNHDHDKSHASYMRVCIKALCECDEIYMINNWRDSVGAMTEHLVAISLNLEIIYPL